MKKKILAIQGSNLNNINYKTDTSMFLGLEAQTREFEIYYYEPKNLSFKNGTILANCYKIRIEDDNRNKPIKNKAIIKLRINLSKFFHH